VSHGPAPYSGTRKHWSILSDSASPKLQSFVKILTLTIATVSPELTFLSFSFLFQNSAYFYSSAELEKSTKQVLPGSEEG
jgi:hypothetical protein